MAQRLIPGVGYVDETDSAQRLIPGAGYVSVSASSTEVSADLVATYAVSSFVSSDFLVSYSVLDAVSVSSDLVATFGVGAFVSSDLTGSYGVREYIYRDLVATYSIASAGIFLSETWALNTDSIWPPGTAVFWTWTVAGRVGSMTGKTIVDGTGTLNAESKLSLSGLPAGAGKLDAAVRGATAADDFEYSQHGTVV